MDILYSKVLKTDEKNEYISDIEYLAKVRVDNGDDENSSYDSDELHNAVIKELKRRYSITIRSLLNHHETTIRRILKQHKITTHQSKMQQTLEKLSLKEIRSILSEIHEHIR